MGWKDVREYDDLFRGPFGVEVRPCFYHALRMRVVSDWSTRGHERNI